MKTKLKRRSKRLSKLLETLAATAIDAQRHADNAHATVTTIASLLSTQGSSNQDASSSSDSADEKNIDDQLDALQAFLDGQPKWLGNNQCREILEGMAAAAKSGNALGAANAMASYIRCMRRPRPKLVTPGPGSDF
jgi:hypothetical protein